MIKWPGLAVENSAAMENTARAASAHPDGVATRERVTQPLIATAMGVSLSTVNRAHMTYDHGGIKALRPRPSGGRKRENMTWRRKRPCWRVLPRPLEPAKC